MENRNVQVVWGCGWFNRENGFPNWDGGGGEERISKQFILHASKLGLCFDFFLFQGLCQGISCWWVLILIKILFENFDQKLIKKKKSKQLE